MKKRRIRYAEEIETTHKWVKKWKKDQNKEIENTNR